MVRAKAKVGGIDFNGYGTPGYKGQAFNTTAEQRMREGRKVGKDWFGGYSGGFGWDSSPMRRNNSKSHARKAASAMIAKIPEVLSRHIAKVYKPEAAA